SAAPAWGLGTEGTGKAGHLFRNDGTGHWQPTNLHLTGADYGALQWSDLDGDGRHREIFVDGKALRVTPSPEQWSTDVDAKLQSEVVWELEQIVGWPTG